MRALHNFQEHTHVFQIKIVTSKYPEEVALIQKSSVVVYPSVIADLDRREKDLRGESDILYNGIFADLDRRTAEHA